MGRPKGSPRPDGAGRKKGTPNKSSLKADDIAQRLGCDPFEILIMFANGDWKGLGYPSATETRYSAKGTEFIVDAITKDQRLKAASEASQYLLPKRKAIDHNILKPIRHEVENLDGSVDVYTNEEE